MNKNRFTIVLIIVGILLALGSGLILTFIERLVVTFREPTVLSLPQREITSREPIACGKSTSAFSSTRRSATGSWIEKDIIDIWISDTFQPGDRADILYYFPDPDSAYPDLEHPGEPTTWSFMRYEAPDIIGKKIRDGSMGPLVFVLPRGEQTFIDIEKTAVAVLSEKGITPASRSFIGHGLGAQRIIGILQSKPTVKSIHLVDPYALYLTIDIIDRYRDKIMMYYNPNNWNQTRRENQSALQQAATLLGDRAQLVTTNHSDILLKYLDTMESCFK